MHSHLGISPFTLTPLKCNFQVHETKSWSLLAGAILSSVGSEALHSPGPGSLTFLPLPLAQLLSYVLVSVSSCATHVPLMCLFCASVLMLDLAFALD